MFSKVAVYVEQKSGILTYLTVVIIYFAYQIMKSILVR